VDWLTPTRITFAQTRELFAFGTPVALGALCGFASRRWDNLFLSHFFGPGPTGMYNLAYNLADVPAIQVGEQIGDVLLPSFARLEGSRRLDAFVRSLTLLGLVVFPLAVGLAAVAPTLVATVFDERWRPVGPMLIVLSALSVMRPIGWTIASYLQARGLTPYILWLEAFKLVCLVLGLVTFGRVSPLSSCAAVGVAFGIHAVLSLTVVRRVDALPLRPVLLGLAGSLAASAVMAAAVVGVRHAFELVRELGAPAALVLEIVVGAWAYVGATLVFARSDAEELVSRVLDATGLRGRASSNAGD
jgi:PST family polysaccharide transporter